MTDQGTKPGPWVFLVWAVVFLTSCLIAAAAWKTLGSFGIDVFPVSTDIGRLGAAVSTLTEHYAALANQQKERVEVWGLAALVLGVSGGVASVLRAPQAVIVGLGGFAAIIFGATQIYNPQRSIQVLNTARSQLACVNPRINALAALRERTEPFVWPAHDSTTEALIPLIKASSSFSAQANRYSAVRLALQDERTVALEAIEPVLLVPYRDVFGELERMAYHLNNVSSIQFDIDKHLHNSPNAELSTLLSTLATLQQDLQQANTTLHQPATLESRLTDGVTAYHDAVTMAVSVIDTGEAVSARAVALTQTLPLKTDQLARWPTEFEAAVSAAHNAVNRIQNTVNSQIAAGGVAETPISEIVTAATDMAIGDTVPELATASDFPPSPSPNFSQHPGNPLAVRADPNRLARQAERAITEARSFLEDQVTLLAQARARGDQLRNLINEHLPILSGTTRRLNDGRFKLEDAIHTVEQHTAAASQALAEADAILNQPAPARLHAEIDTCLSTA